MNVELISNTYIKVKYPDSKNRRWSLEKRIMISQNLLPEAVEDWITQLGYSCPMTTEQEVEFKLRYL